MNGREIKFRVWDGERMWRPGTGSYPFHLDLDGCLHFAGFGDMTEQEEVQYEKRFIALQYTGLSDAEGRQIYEADVVEGQDVVAKKNVRGAARYLPEEGAYVVSAERGVVALADLARRKVIGNRFENPELLEGDA